MSKWFISIWRETSTVSALNSFFLFLNIYFFIWLCWALVHHVGSLVFIEARSM